MDSSKDPELYLDESLLLATMLKHRDIYLAVTELGIENWFFEELSNQHLFSEASKIIDQRTFSELKSCLVAKKNSSTIRLDQIMTLYTDVYRNMFNEDDYMFINFVDNHRTDRQNTRFGEITRNIEKCIKKNEPFSSFVSELDNLQSGKVKNDVMGLDQIVDSMENTETKQKYYTGIEGLDDMIDLVDATLWVVGGESSSGKTSLINQVIFNFCATTKYNTLYFSLETTQERLGTRFAKMVELIDKVDSRGARERLRGIGDRLQVTKLVNDIETIEKMIRSKHKEDDMFKFCAIDYLQIVNVKEKGYEDETPRVAYLIKRLHTLCQELGILLIVLSQLKKEDYNRSKGGEAVRKTPTMNDLRGSSQIVNSADYITINWFKEVHVSQKEPSREVNIQVVKNKEGNQGGVSCHFIKKNVSFVEKF